jgi:hypothetical protein
MTRRFKPFRRVGILTLTIAREEEDSRIYAEFADVCGKTS